MKGKAGSTAPPAMILASNFSFAASRRRQCVIGAEVVVTALRRSVSLLRFKFQFGAQSIDPLVGAIINRPAVQPYEFAPRQCVYVTIFCAGDQ